MTTVKFHSLYLIPLLALGGCAAQQNPHTGTHPVSRAMKQEGVEPAYFTVTGRDAEMKQAVRQARKTVGTFITALQHPTGRQHDFEVKKPFIQGDKKEHIWLANVTYSGNRFHGYVDNTPREIKGLKFGQRVSVNPDEISDWAFIENGNLVGGYTIRVLSNGADPALQAKAEREGNFRIGNQ
jgi:uncharacterized protein YegJ (DUF2314 family)